MSRSVAAAIGLGVLALGWLWSEWPSAQSMLREETTRPANQASVINVWTHEAANSPPFAALAAAAEAFNRSQRQHRVNVVPSIYRYYDERVQSAAATGTLPCVLDIDGPFVPVFAWRGYLQPIDSFVSKALLDDLLPTLIAQGTYNGRLYTLGQFESGLGLWANRRLLLQAGARIPTLERPWTLDEFEQTMARLTALEAVDYALDLAIYTRRSEFYSYAFAPIIQGFGGDLISRGPTLKARGVLDGPPSVAAMKRFQHWFKQGWTRAELDRTRDFENGRAALSWTGHWSYPSFNAALGEDLVLLPLPDFGHGVKTGMGSWSWGISSTCRDTAGASAVLNYLMSAREIERFTNANGAVPARKSIIARSPLYGHGGRLHVFADQLSQGFGVPRPNTPGYNTISRNFAGAVSEIIQGADVQATLSAAAGRIDAEFARNRGYPAQ